MPQKITKFVSFLLCFLLILQQSGFAQILPSSQIILPQSPALLRYLNVNQANPFNYFNFLLDKGEQRIAYSVERIGKDKDSNLNAIRYPLNANNDLNSEAKKLINYFFLGITLPSKDFWVNLRPDEPGRITSDALAKTEMGRILLEQDLRLKRDVAGYLHPANPKGREFWNKLYETIGKDKVKKAKINTSTRVWIVPEEATVVETEDGALVVSAKLKVLLENEYLQRLSIEASSPAQAQGAVPEEQIQLLSESLMREIVIPAITKDVNESQSYAPLRQIYYSLILAEWFKRKTAQVTKPYPAKQPNRFNPYAPYINSGITGGLESELPWEKQAIWQEYLNSYRKGEYKLQDTIFGLKRMYFSGGAAFIELSSEGPSSPLKIIPKNDTAASSALASYFKGANNTLPVITTSSPLITPGVFPETNISAVSQAPGTVPANAVSRFDEEAVPEAAESAASPALKASFDTGLAQGDNKTFSVKLRLFINKLRWNLSWFLFSRGFYSESGSSNVRFPGLFAAVSMTLISPFVIVQQVIGGPGAATFLSGNNIGESGVYNSVDSVRAIKDFDSLLEIVLDPAVNLITRLEAFISIKINNRDFLLSHGKDLTVIFNGASLSDLEDRFKDAIIVYLAEEKQYGILETLFLEKPLADTVRDKIIVSLVDNGNTHEALEIIKKFITSQQIAQEMKERVMRYFYGILDYMSNKTPASENERLQSAGNAENIYNFLIELALGDSMEPIQPDILRVPNDYKPLSSKRLVSPEIKHLALFILRAGHFPELAQKTIKSRVFSIGTVVRNNALPLNFRENAAFALAGVAAVDELRSSEVSLRELSFQDPENKFIRKLLDWLEAERNFVPREQVEVSFSQNTGMPQNDEELRQMLFDLLSFSIETYSLDEASWKPIFFMIMVFAEFVDKCEQSATSNFTIGRNFITEMKEFQENRNMPPEDLKKILAAVLMHEMGHNIASFDNHFESGNLNRSTIHEVVGDVSFKLYLRAINRLDLITSVEELVGYQTAHEFVKRQGELGAEQHNAARATLYRIEKNLKEQGLDLDYRIFFECLTDTLGKWSDEKGFFDGIAQRAAEVFGKDYAVYTFEKFLQRVLKEYKERAKPQLKQQPAPLSNEFNKNPELLSPKKPGEPIKIPSFNEIHMFIFGSLRMLFSSSRRRGQTSKSSKQESASSCIVSRPSSLGASSAASPAEKAGLCLTPDSLIHLADGTTKPLIELKVGEQVLSLNEETQQLEPHKVNALLDMGVKPVYKITTAGGKTLKTTLNHPYLTKDGWKKLREIKVGQEIAAAKRLFWPDSDSVLLDNEEPAFKFSLINLFEEREGMADNFFFGGHIFDVNNHYAAGGMNIKPQDIPEVLIKGKQCEIVFAGISKNFAVSSIPQNSFIDRDNLQPVFSEGINNISIDALVSQDVHRHILGLEDCLSRMFHKFRSVFNGGDNILFGDSRVLFGDFFYSVACANEIQDIAYGNAGSFNTRLAESNLGVYYDFLQHDFATSKTKNTMPVHYRQDIIFESVISIEPLGNLHVYDIEVEGTHNFVAEGIIAHNTYTQAQGASAASPVSAWSEAQRHDAVGSGQWKEAGYEDISGFLVHKEIPAPVRRQIVNLLSDEQFRGAFKRYGILIFDVTAGLQGNESMIIAPRTWINNSMQYGIHIRNNLPEGANADYFYSASNITKSLLHEVGHRVWQNLSEDERIEFRRLFDAAPAFGKTIYGDIAEESFANWLAYLGTDLESFIPANCLEYIKSIRAESRVPLKVTGVVSSAIVTEERREAKDASSPTAKDGLCLTPDSLIHLSDGTTKPLIELKVGERVLSLNEQTQQLEPHKVLALLDMGVKPVYRITTASGKTLKTTLNHPYLTKDGWKKLKEIKAGEEVAVAAGDEFQEKKISLLLEKLNEFFYRNTGALEDRIQCAGFYGLRTMQGDNASAAKVGLVPHNYMGTILTFNKKSVLLQGTDSFFAGDPREFDHTETSTSLNSTFTSDSGIGRPSSLRDQRYNPIASFILDIASSIVSPCEAHPGSAGTWTEYPSPNSGSIITLNRFSISNLPIIKYTMLSSESQANHKLSVISRNTYVQSTPESGILWDKVISIKPLGSQQVYDPIRKPLASNGASIEKDIMWDRIVNIEYLGQRHVYDMEIEGTHNFVAQGIIAHNTYTQAQDASAASPVMLEYFKTKMNRLGLTFDGLDKVDPVSIGSAGIQDAQWFLFAIKNSNKFLELFIHDSDIVAYGITTYTPSNVVLRFQSFEKNAGQASYWAKVYSGRVNELRKFFRSKGRNMNICFIPMDQILSEAQLAKRVRAFLQQANPLVSEDNVIANIEIIVDKSRRGIGLTAEEQRWVNFKDFPGYHSFGPAAKFYIDKLKDLNPELISLRDGRLSQDRNTLYKVSQLKIGEYLSESGIFELFAGKGMVISLTRTVSSPVAPAASSPMQDNLPVVNNDRKLLVYNSPEEFLRKVREFVGKKGDIFMAERVGFGRKTFDDGSRRSRDRKELAEIKNLLESEIRDLLKRGELILVNFSPSELKIGDIVIFKGKDVGVYKGVTNNNAYNMITSEFSPWSLYLFDRLDSSYFGCNIEEGAYGDYKIIRPAEILDIDAGSNLVLSAASPVIVAKDEGGETKDATLAEKDVLCLTPDSLIHLADGTTKPLIALKVGEQVLSLNEETQQLEPHRVNALLDMGVKPVYRMTTAGGKTLKTTLNHPYLTKDGWKKLKEIKAGEEIAVAKSLSSAISIFSGVHSINNNFEANDIKAGAVFSDSESVSSRRQVDQRLGERKGIAGGNVEFNFFKDSFLQLEGNFSEIAFAGGSKIDFLNHYFELMPNSFSIFSKGTSPSLRASSMPFLSLKTKSGFIGRWGSMASISQPTGLWDTYSSAETCSSNFSSIAQNKSHSEYVSNTKYLGEPFLSITTAALKSLEKARPDFLSSFGIAANFSSNSNLTGSFLDNFISDVAFILSSPHGIKYNILFSSLSRLFSADEAEAAELPSAIFRDRIISMEPLGSQRVYDPMRKPSASNGEDIMWDRIVNIEYLGQRHVYDMEIEGTHNFVAQGIIAHNTYTQAQDASVSVASPIVITKENERRTRGVSAVSPAAISSSVKEDDSQVVSSPEAVEWEDLYRLEFNPKIDTNGKESIDSLAVRLIRSKAAYYKRTRSFSELFLDHDIRGLSIQYLMKRGLLRELPDDCLRAEKILLAIKLKFRLTDEEIDIIRKSTLIIRSFNEKESEEDNKVFREVGNSIRYMKKDRSIQQTIPLWNKELDMNVPQSIEEVHNLADRIAKLILTNTTCFLGAYNIGGQDRQVVLIEDPVIEYERAGITSLSDNEMNNRLRQIMYSELGHLVLDSFIKEDGWAIDLSVHEFYDALFRIIESEGGFITGSELQFNGSLIQRGLFRNLLRLVPYEMEKIWDVNYESFKHSRNVIYLKPFPLNPDELADYLLWKYFEQRGGGAETEKDFIVPVMRRVDRAFLSHNVAHGMAYEFLNKVDGDIDLLARLAGNIMRHPDSQKIFGSVTAFVAEFERQLAEWNRQPKALLPYFGTGWISAASRPSQNGEGVPPMAGPGLEGIQLASSPAISPAIRISAEESQEVNIENIREERLRLWREFWEKKGSPLQETTITVKNNSILIRNWAGVLTEGQINRIQNVLAKTSEVIGEKALENCTSIYISDVQPINPLDQSVQNGTIFLLGKSITLFPNALRDISHRVSGVENLEGTIIHELAHLFTTDAMKEMWQNKFWAIKDFVDGGGRGKRYEPENLSDCVTNYARLNVGDDIAESVVVAIMNPELLNQKKLNYLRNTIFVSLSGAINPGNSGHTVLNSPEKTKDGVQITETSSSPALCLTPDSLIHLADGTTKPLIALKVGEQVLSLNEETQQLEPHRVNALLDMGVKPVYRMTTAGGKTLKTTLNHPYLTKDGWKKLREIKVGQEIMVFESVLKAQGVERRNMERLSGRQKSRFCICADKYRAKSFEAENRGKDNGVIATQAVFKDEVIGNEEYFPLNISYGDTLAMQVKVKPAHNLTEIFRSDFLFSVVFIEDGSKFGDGNGRDDNFVFRQRKNFIQNSGSFFPAVSFYQSAGIQEIDHLPLFFLPDFCDGIRKIAFNFGESAPHLRKGENLFRQPPLRNVFSARADMNAFLAQLLNGNFAFRQGHNLLLSIFKNSIFAKSLSSILSAGNAYAQSTPESGILWDKIVSIEPLGNLHVYDIEVQGTHNFVAQGIIAHNTYTQAQGASAASPENQGQSLSAPGGIDLSNIEITLKDEKYISSLNPADIKVLRAAKALEDNWDSLSVLYVHEIMLLLKDGIVKDMQNKKLLRNVLRQLRIRDGLDIQAAQFLQLMQSEESISEMKLALVN